MTNNFGKSGYDFSNLERESNISLTYKRQSSSNDQLFGNVSVFVSPDLAHRVMAVDKVLYDGEEAQAEVERLAPWLSLRHKNLVNLLDYAVSVTKTSKSVVICIRSFYEFPGVSLKKIVSDGQNSKALGIELSLGHLQQLIKDIVDAMVFLFAKGLCHGSINLNSVFFNLESFCFKLAPLNACLETVNQYHLEAMLKGETIFVSPQIASAFKSNRTFGIQHNQEKSDIFSLGLIFMRLLLKDLFVSIYDRKGNFRRKEYKKALYSLNAKLEKYPKLTPLIKRMLEFKEENRPTLLELKELLQSSTQNQMSEMKVSTRTDKVRGFTTGPFNQPSNWANRDNHSPIKVEEKALGNKVVKVGSVLSNHKITSNPFFSKLTEDENRSSIVSEKHILPKFTNIDQAEIIGNSENSLSRDDNRFAEIRTNNSLSNAGQGDLSLSSKILHSMNYRSISPVQSNHHDGITRQKWAAIPSQSSCQKTNSVVRCTDNFFNETYRCSTTSAQKVVAPVSTPIEKKTFNIPVKSFEITPSRFETHNQCSSFEVSTPIKHVPFQKQPEQVLSRRTFESVQSHSHTYRVATAQLPHRRISVSNSPILIEEQFSSPISTHFQYSVPVQNCIDNVIDNHSGRLIKVRNTGQVKLLDGHLFKEIVEEFENENSPNFRSVTIRSRFVRADTHSIISSPHSMRSISPLVFKRHSVCQRINLAKPNESEISSCIGRESYRRVLPEDFKNLVSNSQEQVVSSRTLTPKTRPIM